ncbi:MAG TPA: hypothetical protein VMF29_05350 [Candidatus Edwardsbacteria bacterium]|nr:hypothetical protein [Candidatus Edwardsbacteria bacterium]
MNEIKKISLLKAAGIGGAALIVVLMIAAGTAYLRRGAIARWAKQKAVQGLSRRVLLDLPDGVDRARVQRDLALLEARVGDGSVDRIRLAAILGATGRALEDKKLDRQEAEAIIGQIEQAVR